MGRRRAQAAGGRSALLSVPTGRAVVAARATVAGAPAPAPRSSWRPQEMWDACTGGLILPAGRGGPSLPAARWWQAVKSTGFSGSVDIKGAVRNFQKQKMDGLFGFIWVHLDWISKLLILEDEIKWLDMKLLFGFLARVCLMAKFLRTQIKPYNDLAN